MPIPGMPAMMAGDLSLKFLTSAVGLSGTITIPAETRAGDILVMQDSGGGAFVPPTALAPAGWTEMGNTTGTKVRFQSRYKIAESSDAGSSMSTLGVLGGAAIISVFRPSSPVLSIDAPTPEQEGTSGNPAPQTISLATLSGPLIAISCYASDSVIDPRTFSPSADGEVSSADGTNVMAYKIFNSVAADCTVDMDAEGSENHMHSFYLRVA